MGIAPWEPTVGFSGKPAGNEPFCGVSDGNEVVIFLVGFGCLANHLKRGLVF